MKQILRTNWRWLMAMMVAGLPAWAQETVKSPLPATSFSIVERGPHTKVVQSLRQTTNGTGQTVLVTNRYTAIQNGLNRRDASSGQWIECSPVVQTYTDAIVCTGATYRVILNRNLHTDGAVDLEMSNGGRIVSHPVSIGFYDPEDGRSALLAQVKDCQAVVSSNRIVFSNAFEGSGIKAAVIYSYDVGRFAQDVRVLKWPSTLTPSAFQMSARTRLEVISEIVQSPVPTITEQVFKRETNEVKRAQMVEPDLVNQIVHFDEVMIMPLGRAFQEEPSDGRPARGRIPVVKRLLDIDGRKVIVEAVEWEAVREKLPQQSGGVVGTNQQASLKRELPPRQMAVNRTASFESRLAQVTGSRPVSGLFAALSLPQGFTVDWVLLDYWEDVVFEAGQTYLVNGSCWLYNVTFQPGAVIKYERGASMFLDGEINWPLYGPKIILTAVDDDSVGDDIDEVPSTVSGYYAGPPLMFEYLPGRDVIVGNFDIRYAWYGVGISESTVFLHYSVIRDCDVGVEAYYSYVYLVGVEMCNVTTTVSAYESYGYLTPMSCGEDSDNDWMPDSWELQYFNDSLEETGSGDADNDGLTNLQEYQGETNPRVADVDGDSLPNGWEFTYFGNITSQSDNGNPDGDGLLNTEEYLFVTNPTVSDLPGGSTGLIQIHTPLQ